MKLSCVRSFFFFLTYNKSFNKMINSNLKIGHTMGPLISSPVGSKKAEAGGSFCQPVKVVISGSLSTCTAWRPAVLCANCCLFTSVHLRVNCCTMSMLIARHVIASLPRPYLTFFGLNTCFPCKESHSPGISKEEHEKEMLVELVCATW